MSRLVALAIAVLPAVAGAYGPQFSRGAFYLNFEYGPGAFAFSYDHLAPQVGPDNATWFVREAVQQWSHTASARFGFNFIGHVSVEAILTGAGWDLLSIERGGGGFLGGVVAWHPLQLFFYDDRQFDVSVFAGGGWGIVGEDRGADGIFLTAGASVDYYFNPSVFLGLFYRYIKPEFDKFYVNYEQRALEGNTILLPANTGGSFTAAGLTLGFHFPLY